MSVVAGAAIYSKHAYVRSQVAETSATKLKRMFLRP